MATASASGLTPSSMSLTQTTKASLSKPVLRRLEISDTAEKRHKGYNHQRYLLERLHLLLSVSAAFCSFCIQKLKIDQTVLHQSDEANLTNSV